MATPMRTIALHSYTMLAKQKEGTPNPWAGPRLSVKVMGGALVRINISLNDRSSEGDDEYFGCTFSVQTLAECTSLVEQQIAKNKPFELVITQARWVKALNEDVSGALCLIRDEKSRCFIKLEMAGKQDVLFPYKAIEKSSITIGSTPVGEDVMSPNRCVSWWKRMCRSLDTANIVLLALDAGSFGGDDNVGSAGTKKPKFDDFDDDIAF